MADHDPETGRFLPGNQASVGYGRPPKEQEQAYIDAVVKALPPEKLADLLVEMLTVSDSTRSWRGKEAAVRLALEYAVGKPTQRIQQQSGSLAEVLDMLRDGEEE